MNWGITICVFLSWIVLADTMGIEVSEGDLEDKVCQGTNTKVTTRGDDAFRYEMYRNLYMNCTYVDGNLEIVFLEDDKIDFDLSFLKDIREVTGYVLIVAVCTPYIPLVNLRIIRGRTLYLYKEEYYSLFVSLNTQRGSGSRGLMELRFTSLYEILDGKVFFYNNNLLCYENTINWQDINPSKTPAVESHFDSEYNRRTCGECDPACFQNTTRRRHCWGSGPDMCQKFNRRHICHPECVGGCTGPDTTDCWACRNFKNEGECVPFCPPLEIYDDKLYAYRENPNGKYAYGPLCVKECPKHLIKDRSSCVKSCGPRKHSVNGTCEPCKGRCPKVCKGNGDRDFLSASMLQNYKDCTVIDGNLRILQATFDGDEWNAEPPIRPSELEVLASVVEITGYLIIQSRHPDLKNLSFLRHLETIQGRSLDTIGNALSIFSTPLESLDLVNLKSINIGKVLISKNANMCFADTIDFKKLFSSRRSQEAFVTNNKDPLLCRAEHLICDAECSNDGCWGSGPEKCLSCRTYRVENSKLCVRSCQDKPKLYAAVNNICQKCDDQCFSTCTGPLPSQCDRCLNVNDGPNCAEECPKQKYPDENDVCQPCHPNCLDGCYYNSSYVNARGCVNCQIGIIRMIGPDRVVECLPKDSECEDGYFKSQVPMGDHTPMAGKLLCEPCHEQCLTCDGRGAGFCRKCKNYQFDRRCVPSCMSLMYATPNKECRPCHSECSTGCSGPDSTDCAASDDLKVYINKTAKEFNCTNESGDMRKDWDITELARALKSIIIPELEKMFDAKLNALAVLNDELKRGNGKLKKKQEFLLKQNNDLKRANEGLKQKQESLVKQVDTLEQYTRRNNLRIKGIPENDGEEDTDDVVVNFARHTLHIDLDVADIDRTHRIGKKGDGVTRSIIAKFTNYRARSRMYKARTTLKSEPLTAKIYIDEDLTKHRYNLLKEALKLRKINKIKQTWTHNGRVFVRDLANKVHLIEALSELEQLLN